MKRLQVYLTIAMLLCLAATSAPAQSVVLENTARSSRPTREALLLVDTSGSVSAAEAFARLDEFVPFERASVPVAREGAMWLFLRFENRTATAEWILANTMNLELIELYEQDGDEWRLSSATGNAVPFADRELSARTPAFSIRVPEGGTTAVLLRTFDLQSSSVQLEISGADEYWEAYRHETLLLGLAFGFFAALIIYNAIVFVTNRDPTYLVYSFYMIAFAINQFAQERLIIEYVQPNRPYGFFWFVAFGSLTALLGVEFFRRLIGTRSSMPKTDKAMRIVQVLLGGVLVAGIFAAGPLTADLLNVLSLATMGLIVYVLAVRIRDRDAIALVCLVGSLLYFAGTVLEILSTLVPMQVGEFVLHAQLYGALAQVLILAFALGTRTHRIQEEYNRVQQAFRTELEKRVRDRTRDLQIATRRLEQESVTDELTGLYNRKELNLRSAELDKRIERTSREGESFAVTLAYIDLDNFKLCNDTSGHAFGDDLLKRTARVIREETRGYDLAFRVGGDEFVIIMPETTLENGHRIVLRIHDKFADAMPAGAPISMSIGLASTRERDDPSVSVLIDAADAALLSAKASGKNTIAADRDIEPPRRLRHAPHD